MLTLTKKKIFVILFLTLAFAGVLSNTFAISLVKPTNIFYVNDYANLLSDETEQYILNTNKSLQSQTGAQIVVVTVPNLGGQEIESYATALFREFGIGSKAKNNGVLILLALEERKIRIEVGYGLEGALPDGKTGRIRDAYMIPYLKQNDWNAGIKNGFSAILKDVEAEYKVTAGSTDAIIDPSYDDTTIEVGKYFNYSLIMIFACPIVGYILGKLYFKNKINKKKRFLWSILFFVINVVITALLAQEIISTLFFIFFGFIWFIIFLMSVSITGHLPKGNSGSSWGGSGGGSWGRRRLFGWWRIIWRRRFFRELLK